MSSVWIYTIVSVVVVSAVSLVGVFTLSINIDRLRKWLLYMVSFAAGALLGDAFIHLLPEVLEEADDVSIISLYILAGIIFFFILEKVIYWRHCHLPTTEMHPHPVGMINLVGDGFHNFIDGAIIAGSYLISVPVGIATTLAVVLHEIPQEIGDFSILIHAGYTKAKALLFNLGSGLVAIAGAVLTILVGSLVEHAALFLVPFTIGGFIYIAAADLIPEIHREEHTGRSFLQLFYFLLGIGIMGALLLLE